jgi:Tol biopolymer transport system component
MTARLRAVAPLAIAALLVTAALGGAIAGAKGGAEPTTTLVSRAGKSGKGGDGNSVEPKISGNGRFVAFASRADNLSPLAKQGIFEIYVRDLRTGKTTLVSRADGASGAAADRTSSGPSISADGRYVAFFSEAQNLSAEDTASGNIFVRDLVAGTTTLVSRASGAAGAAADERSNGAAISADGRHVAFSSLAANLGADDKKHTDIFVRDLDSSVTELISRASGATGTVSDELSSEPSISGDGRFVAFVSRAPLVADDVDDVYSHDDVFVRDRATATTILASRKAGPAGAAGDRDSGDPAISADGRHVVFTSQAGLTGKVFVARQVYVRDLADESIDLVSVGDDDSAFEVTPSISADGRYVAFASSGEEISPVDADGRLDVFVRDMSKGLTVTVSRASGRLGLPSDGPSGHGSISADGSRVAFDSRALNLSGADEDDAIDVFLRRIVYAKEPSLPRCHGRVATLIGTPGPDVLTGTPRKNVVLALGGDDSIHTISEADVICAGRGRDTIDAGGSGEGNSGSDLVLAGPGADRVVLGAELGLALGEGGNDLLIGSKGGETLRGGSGDDVLRGGPNPYYNTDFLFGGPGDDRLEGGPGPNQMYGGPGRDVVTGQRE